LTFGAGIASPTAATPRSLGRYSTFDFTYNRRCTPQ
jgi:hypothetical protein